MNGNANYEGADLIDAAGGDMVVVNFNYRVGPYGFLASKEIEANQTLSLNNGLKDQRLLLKWVQKYIHEFGGDANHVTLGGRQCWWWLGRFTTHSFRRPQRQPLPRCSCRVCCLPTSPQRQPKPVAIRRSAAAFRLPGPCLSKFTRRRHFPKRR